MEDEEDYGPGKFTTVLVLVIAFGLALSVGAVLVFNLQPKLSTGGGGGPAAVTIVLPNGVGANPSLNYEPPTVTVIVGVNNTIKWVDQDSIPHTVTSSSGTPTSFDSRTMNQGDTFTVTLTTPGTYGYFCQFHPGWMKGTVVVKAGSG